MKHITRFRWPPLAPPGAAFLSHLIFLSLCHSGFRAQNAFQPPDTLKAFAQVRDGSSPADAIDLNGPWKFKATDHDDWADALVPGTVQLDLLRNGTLKDPFYRDNEFEAQWVEQKEWEYERSFAVDPEFLLHDRILLECRGLDTICELFLNGAPIAKTQNMFVEYEFDVKQFLRKGTNVIRVVFRSVLEWNRRQAEAEPRVTWFRKSPTTTDAMKGLLFFSRKEASDFGWDWGIRLLSCGIWKPIRLAAYDVGRITALGVRQDLTHPKEAFLDVTVDVEAYRKTTFQAEVNILFENRSLSRISLPVADGKARGRIRISNPKLWWPNGWGEHPLYTVNAELRNAGKTVHERRVRIGLRTVTIEREKDDRGETFALRVNGSRIFCKGTNWIPSDALPNRLTEGQHKHLLGSCVEANMNTIRLWGGGLYEPDVFYEFCDENGLLIWHDFMFATGPYLAVESYLENVREEIRSVVLRRRHHASIALWCGNNESEYNMAGGQNWLANFPTVQWADFDKIFYETIPQTAALYDPDRPYWPSSPRNPLDREKKRPDFETASGTVHTYEVWGGEKRFSAYNEMGKYRFVAEFGFQSLPHAETVRAFTAPEDRYFPSSILDHHNLTGRKPAQNQGNVRIATFTADLFRMPAGLKNWISVSQILQGEGIKMGCEALRRNYPNSTGSLYWQLNDNWPVISWSGIDYFGRWKALHYMAKRFFSPVLLSGVVKSDSVLVYGTNDRLQDEAGALEWALSRFDGTEIRRGSVKVCLPANRSILLAGLDFSKETGENPELVTYRKDSYRNRKQVYLAIRFVQGDNMLSSNVVFFVPPKYWPLEEPGIHYSITRERGQHKIVLSAERFAAFVELGLKDGYARFSDNFFHLLPGESKTVFTVSSEIPENEFRNRFFINSLIDTYSRYSGF